MIVSTVGYAILTGEMAK